MTEVDRTSRQLATLLSFLGRSEIPEVLFDRSRFYLVWGEDGEVAHNDTDITEVVKNKELYEKAVEGLCQVEAISLESNTKSRYVSVNHQLLTQVAYSQDLLRWKIEAVKTVLYAFPIDRRLDPSLSYPIVHSILPHLEHVLPFLNEDDIATALPAAHVVEVCLSASNYSGYDWKYKALKAA